VFSERRQTASRTRLSHYNPSFGKMPLPCSRFSRSSNAAASGAHLPIFRFTHLPCVDYIHDEVATNENEIEQETVEDVAHRCIAFNLS
jgi:hypothetical protein